MPTSLPAFIAKWTASGASERANKDAFLIELCDALDVPRPEPTTGDGAKDTYVFERDARLAREGGLISVGKIDLYKAGCFILEAKQGSEQGAKKVGTAKRGTPAWNIAMRDAYGQALGYARSFGKAVPFLIATDLGYCFDLYAAFDGSWDYRPFPNAQSSRIYFADLSRHTALLRSVFLDPFSLDPSKHAAKVTQDVAVYLANLAKQLEAEGHSQELVATFLMRCIFTMFAEDVGLLPAGAFSKALREFWIPSPASFCGGIESLWRTMNEGGHVFGVIGRILQFNGGLFRSPVALPLSPHALQLLLVAAECNWAEVEPAIFGTLIERALDPRERHRLGAHYTPRAYVERIVRPAIEEPLRADWAVVQAEVGQHVAAAEASQTEKGRKERIKQAVSTTRAFLQKLSRARVLDPACGSGNFLYVTLDTLKRLEGEVLALLESLGEKQTLLHMETFRVTPAQFYGIEIKRWAKEIAELVLWIGYLQWHFRTYGKNLPVPEPVLQDYRNIECRDAILAYDSEELVLDERAKPVTRWDGETMKVNPLTGEEVPDASAQVPMYRYLNPRAAAWPEVDFIVGNPPFIANRNLRRDLGDGYVDAIASSYPDGGDAIDFVMYFWGHAADLVQRKAVRRAGFITTNSIRMIRNQSVVLRALESGVRIVFAIPDHPWPVAKENAKVRVSMTVLASAADPTPPRLLLAEGHDQVARGRADLAELTEADFSVSPCTAISADLAPGVTIDQLVDLRACAGILHSGMKPYAATLIVSPETAAQLFPDDHDRRLRAPQYRNGQDVARRPRNVHVLDLYGLSEAEVREQYPKAYQYLLDYVRPERSLNRDARARASWWLFQRDRPELRRALAGLPRYIVTVENSPARYFTFLDQGVCPDQKLRVVAHDDAYVLGVLSSRAHELFSLRVGGRQGVANTPVYNTRCIERFPFPDCSNPQKVRIRQLGEAIEQHRKRQQATHPKLTLSGMYTVLSKIRSATALTEADKAVHRQGLLSVLNKLHEDLDVAVLEAYGWPRDLSDDDVLGRLVALNGERADEERRGDVRWLRAEYQGRELAVAPAAGGSGSDGSDEDEDEPALNAVGAISWPAKLSEKISAIRDLTTRASQEWSVEEVASSFVGARRSDVEEVLDGLAALGLLVSYELVDGKRWIGSRFVR